MELGSATSTRSATGARFMVTPACASSPPQPAAAVSRSAADCSDCLSAEGLFVALGAASLTPLEMAVAFNCFNNGGKRVVPLTIREIRGPNDELLESREPQALQAMKPETAYALRSMLMDVVRAGTGTRASVPKVETFGKTGTSNDFIDAWFVGGTPGLTAAVYVGKDIEDRKSVV